MSISAPAITGEMMYATGVTAPSVAKPDVRRPSSSIEAPTTAKASTPTMLRPMLTRLMPTTTHVSDGARVIMVAPASVLRVAAMAMRNALMSVQSAPTTGMASRPAMSGSWRSSTSPSTPSSNSRWIGRMTTPHVALRRKLPNSASAAPMSALRSRAGQCRSNARCNTCVTMPRVAARRACGRRDLSRAAGFRSVAGCAACNPATCRARAHPPCRSTRRPWRLAPLRTDRSPPRACRCVRAAPADGRSRGR